MRTRECSAVRRRLSEYHDGELPVEVRVAVEGHLRSCAACRDAASDLRALSEVIRERAAATEDHARLDALAATVVGRMRVEREESFRGRAARLFDDMHLVWAGLGAAGAAVACLAIVFTLFSYAVDVRPDSISAMLATQSSPAGSDQNPFAQLSDALRLPTAMDAAFPEAATDHQDAVLALAAVVTRDGRLKHVEMLPGNVGSGPQTVERDRRQVEAILDTISKTRFKPARYGGSPVAVNMVWVYEHLTVRGKVPAGSRAETGAKVLTTLLPRAASRAA